MKRKIILTTVLSFVFGLSGVTFAYEQMTKTQTTDVCCCKEDCCKGDSCPMGKKADATTAARKKDCCCPGSKSTAVKSAD
jgi:hypothetical protein